MSFRDNFSAAEQEELIASAMKTLGLRKTDAERLLHSRARPAKRNPLLDAQWVKTLQAVCSAITSRAAKPLGIFASVFWIRLYGVLTDLRNRYRSTAELHEHLSEQGKPHPFIGAAASVYRACQEMHDSLSDDELIFVTFVRHVHAHVYQDSFEFEVERGNPEKNQPAAVRTKQMVPTVRRHVDVEEAHQVVDRLFIEHGNSDDAVVQAFALKVQPFVERLQAAMHALELERQRDRERSAALGVARDDAG